MRYEEATMTNEDAQGDSIVEYWDAVRDAACAACLDAADDGSCGLRDRVCALPAHLPAVVAAILRVESSRMDEYVQAIEDDVCRGCQESDTAGRCALRDQGRCGLYAYLPLIVDAIDEVRALPQHP
jgi:hypothetical protein